MQTNQYLKLNEYKNYRRFNLMSDEDTFELIYILNQRFLLCPDEVIDMIYNNE